MVQPRSQILTPLLTKPYVLTSSDREGLTGGGRLRTNYPSGTNILFILSYHVQGCWV
jgi:hypothetical protein